MSIPAAVAPLQSIRPRWTPVESPDLALVQALASELNLPLPLCRLLVQRDYGEAARAKAFLRPAASQIHPPSGLAGMADAVLRLQRAIARGETILVHGDYDVDGICSTALLVRALRMMGGRAVPFVPHRIRDGYDLTDAGLRAAQAAGAKLIVTADCGIVAHEAVGRAAMAGVDVIVTDHHTPGPTLPSALAVINPNRPDCGYPDKSLAGVGVAFKLVAALAEAVGFPEQRLTSLLDLVAVATIADLAPLTGENRALVRWGLKVLVNTPNAGLRALLRVTRLEGEQAISAGQVGYVLAPRINAVGRMDDAMRGVHLLLTDDARIATDVAQELEVANRERRRVDEETLSDAMGMVERDFDPARDRAIVLASTRWHPGVIGIVASRIVERIHRPTVLVALGEEEGKGSARSIPGFHLYRAFAACAPHLLRFGGHKAAAGCSVAPDRLDAFRAAFMAHADAEVTDEQLTPNLRIDAHIAVADAGPQMVRWLTHFAPFGVGNATPVFVATGVRLEGPRIVGSQHLKVTLRASDAGLDGIGFGMADRAAECGDGSVAMDVAFKLEENSWTPARGGGKRTSIQARIVDFRASG
jgi:single-stranded-DNA-specific exonuclease